MTEVVLHPAAGELMAVNALSIIALANRYNSVFDNRGKEKKRQILKKIENNSTANNIFGHKSGPRL